MAFLACAIVVSAGKKPPPAKKAEPPKKACMVCRGLGDDCKSSKTMQGCDKCTKFTGVADDPNQVPSWIWPMLEADGPGAKDQMKKKIKERK